MVRRFGVALVSSFISLVALSSVGLVSSSIHWTRSLVVGICPLALSSALRHWAMPSIVGLYPSLLGSPFGAGLPSAAPSSLGSTFRRAFVSAFRRWVITFVVGPCRCGICYASMVVRHPHSSSSLFSTPPLAGITIVGAPPCGWACWVRVCDALCVVDGWVICMLVRRTCDYWAVGVVDGWWCG